MTYLKLGIYIMVFLLVMCFLNSVFAWQDEEKAIEIAKSKVGKIAVQYDGLVGTVDSFAQAKLFAISGKKSFRGLSATYVVLGIIFHPERWQKEQIIPLRHKKLIQQLKLQPAAKVYLSAEDVLSEKFTDQLRDIIHTKDDLQLAQSAYELFARAQQLAQLGSEFCILPPHNELETKWSSPFNLSQESLPAPISGLLKAIKDYYEDKTEIPNVQKQVTEALAELSKMYSQYPPAWRRNLDSFYARKNPFQVTLLIYLVAGIGWFVFFVRRSRVLYYVSLTLTSLALIVHTIAIVIRFILAGYVPLSNMYESLVFFIWAIVLIAIIAEFITVAKRRGILAASATLIGLLILITLSQLPLSFSRIAPLRAVLNSSWLIYHVITLLVAYAAFALAFIFSLVFLIKDFTNDRLLRWLPDRSLLDDLNYRLIQLGWPLLGVGILTGAIWADTAWGRPWSWDPKETWSLITWLIYAGFLHLRIIKRKKGRILAIASVVGFIAVLITWFGVSYLKIFSGGLHTYA